MAATPAAPAAGPLLLLALVAAASALPGSLLQDVRRAEQLRASAPGPLAGGPRAHASAVVPVAARASRAAPAAPPPPPPPPPAHRAPAAMDADTEKAAAAAVAAAAAAGRPKRDLGVDPEQLLALLALWQQQQQRAPLDPALAAPLGAPLAAPVYSRHPARLPGYDFNDPDDWELSMDNNDIDSEDEGPVGAWLEAPPFAQARPPPVFGGPRHSFYLPALPPPMPIAPAAAGPGPSAKRETAWAGLAKEKRFMVSRKRQATPPSSEGGMNYLARLLAPPPRNPGIPIVRRVLL